MMRIVKVVWMSRLLCVAVMFLALLGCQSTPPMTPAEATAQKMRAAMPIKCETESFWKVVEFFQSTTGLNIVVNWTALETVGVTGEARVTVEESKMPIERALSRVLQQLQTGDQFNPVASFIDDDGVILISTYQELFTHSLKTRIDDVTDFYGGKFPRETNTIFASAERQSTEADDIANAFTSVLQPFLGWGTQILETAQPSKLTATSSLFERRENNTWALNTSSKRFADPRGARRSGSASIRFNLRPSPRTKQPKPH